VTVFDGETKAGGFIRTQIPRFRLPESVIDEETGYILDLGVQFRSGERIESMKALMAQGHDAIRDSGRHCADTGRERIRIGLRY
jgi:formate dehydrogenase (NADP+) beta subunit